MEKDHSGFSACQPHVDNAMRALNRILPVLFTAGHGGPGRYSQGLTICFTGSVGFRLSP